jgi:hypothetical protein
MIRRLLAGLMAVAALCLAARPLPSSNRLAPAISAAGVTRFENVAQPAGLEMTPLNGASPDKHLVETMGSGGVFFDMDGDGWVDIFLVDGGSVADPAVARRARHRLYRNRGNGAFEDVTAASGIVPRGYGQGACAADIDNDGLIDLYVTGFTENALYRNRGRGRFQDATRQAGVAAGQWSTSCAFADVDRDGFVDLFVTRYVDAGMSNNKFCGDPARSLRVYCHPLNYQGLTSVLYHNNHDGTFKDVSASAGISRYAGNGLGVVIGDYDDDGWPDVFVANDSVPNFLFHNERDGTFKEVGLLAGVAVANDGKPRAGMGTDFGDYDGDGRLDLAVGNHEFESTSLFRNLGNGLFSYATTQSRIAASTLAYVTFGLAWLDYDNDGWLDLAAANGHVVDNTALVRPGSSHAQPRLLFHNNRDRTFTDVSQGSGPGFAAQKVGRTLVVADIDNDGDPDMLITNNGQAVDLLRNEGDRQNNALLLRLVGTRSNRDGIGARVRLTVGSATQVREVKAGSSYLGQNDTRLHFGLGNATSVDRLEIRWPSGTTENVSGIAANQIVTLTEGQGATTRAPLRGR